MKKLFICMLGVMVILGIAASGCAKKSSKAGSSSLSSEDIPLDETNINFTDASHIPALAEDIHFDYNKSSIREDAKPILKGVAGYLNKHPNKHVMIEGHCDNRGSKEYNLALGEQRALSARRYIVNLGIEPKRLHTISYGEENPIATGNSEAAHAKNRRGHFLISQ